MYDNSVSKENSIERINAEIIFKQKDLQFSQCMVRILSALSMVIKNQKTLKCISY